MERAALIFYSMGKSYEIRKADTRVLRIDDDRIGCVKQLTKCTLFSFILMILIIVKWINIFSIIILYNNQAA